MRIASAIVLSLSIYGTAAASYTGTADYFVFPNWNDSTIDAGSQTFTGLGMNGDINVTVRINNDFTGSGTTSANRNGWINLGHEQAGSDSLIFDFSKPVVPLVRVSSVDPEENLSVFSSSSVHAYEHDSGMSPTVTMLDGGLQLNGQGFGQHVSTGEIYGNELVSRITVTHQALATFKYDRVQIGQIVPEPSTACLLFIGFLALLSLRGKR